LPNRDELETMSGTDFLRLGGHMAVFPGEKRPPNGREHSVRNPVAMLE
jgi:hypothetical protein